MAITVTGKLNKQATQFQAGESVGFGVRLGVKFYDRETKQDDWTNYEAVIFAKAPAQIQFYQQTLVEGAVIEVSGDKCRIKQFQGQNGLSLSVEILDAKIGFVFNPQGQQNQQQAQQRPQQSNQQRPQQQAPQQRRQPPPQGYQGQMPQQGFNQNQFGPDDFDSDIPL